MLDSTKNGGKDCDMVVLNIIDENNKIGGVENEITILSNNHKERFHKQDKLTLSFEIAKAIKKNMKE